MARKPKRKTRPFPWRCPACLKDEVRPSTTQYSTWVKRDGRFHDINIPELHVPRCGACGELVFGNDTDDQITAEIARVLGVAEVQREVNRGRNHVEESHRQS